jgi:glyoxylase-like metal-dependent hydrolase (beta-lactamase superfamily II)
MSTPLDYPFEAPPEEGQVREVAPGILWVRMPLELTGLNHINLWALRDGDGWTIVDTGMKSDLIKSCWERIFVEELDGLPIKRVICTHFHPDHMGLAGWLCERWQVQLWATFAEWTFGRMIYLQGQSSESREKFEDFFRHIGFGEQAVDLMAKNGPGHYVDAVSPIPNSFRRLREGQEIAIGPHLWRVMIGEGHSPEHACLYNEELGIMLAGDQILPRITPHIGIYPEEPEGNKLQEYLDSVVRYKELPNDTLLLPAHGLPFRGVRQRVDYLLQHHAIRLEALVAMLDQPTRIMSTLKVMFDRQLKPTEVFLGAAESLAHLNCLIGQGRITRSVDADGVWTFQRCDVDSAAA